VANRCTNQGGSLAGEGGYTMVGSVVRKLVWGLVALLIACRNATALNIGGWEVDLSLSALLGTKGDDGIRPEE